MQLLNLLSKIFQNYLPMITLYNLLKVSSITRQFCNAVKNNCTSPIWIAHYSVYRLKVKKIFRKLLNQLWLFFFLYDSFCLFSHITKTIRRTFGLSLYQIQSSLLLPSEMHYFPLWFSETAGDGDTGMHPKSTDCPENSTILISLPILPDLHATTVQLE